MGDNLVHVYDRGYDTTIPKRPACCCNHRKATESLNSTSKGRQPDVPISTARPVWCSLTQGGAEAARIWKMDSPAANLLLTTSVCRSILRNADTTNKETSVSDALLLRRPHASVAIGCNRCCRPPGPISAIISSLTSNCSRSRVKPPSQMEFLIPEELLLLVMKMV